MSIRLFDYFSDQGCPGAMVHFYLYVIPFSVRMIGFWKDDHLILTVSAAPVISALFGITFDEHLKRLAEVLPVLLQRKAVLEPDDLIEPSFLYLFWYIIGIAAGCKRARPFAVKKHVAHVEARTFDDAQALPMILFRLCTEARDDVCAEAAIRQDSPNAINPSQV